MAETAWGEHERAQLARWSQLSHAQRLAWLWEAKMFAQRAMAAARAREAQPAARAVGQEPCDN